MIMTQTILNVLAFLSLAVLGLTMRFRPLWINPRLGGDNWYWLLCAEDVKRRRKLPPKLPYFMLEIEEQWYPPLYAGLLALLPMDLLEKHGGKVSQIIDLLHMVLISTAVFWLSGSVLLTFLSGLSYIVAYLPMSYNTQLQPRGLASLLLSLIMTGLWFYLDTHDLAFLIGMLGFSAVLLFLHKMTVQIWIVYIFAFWVWTGDWKIFLLLPTSLMLAIIVSKGFYLKVLKAHWEIISFWHENIHFLGGHQYYESPLYCRRNSKPNLFHKKSLRRLGARFIRIFQYNTLILLLPVLAYLALNHPLSPLDNFLWIWLGLTYLLSFSTTFLPYFMALGEGNFYVYQSFFPLFLLMSLSVTTMPSHLQIWFYGLWGIGIVYSIVKWEKYCQHISHNKTSTIGEDLKEVQDYLRKLPKDGIFCIPFQLPDGTAYWTRKKVFWGGHSYGFHTLLKPYFPIMRKDVKETLKSNPLNYLLFWRGYLKSLRDIGLEEGKDIRYLFGKGEYEVYEIIK